MDNVYICIPARYGSSRLEGKPLMKIMNKTIINHVYDNVSKLNYKTVILTDDHRIYNEVICFGGKVEMITEYCLNGTDRIIKYLRKHNINEGVIVNVQGDEPFIDHKNIEAAINNYFDKKKNDNSLVCSTLFYETKDPYEVKSRSRGKLVLNKNSDIMYCSRNIIPAFKSKEYNEEYKYKIHVGIFVFDCEYLLNNYEKENTDLQLCEDIEWMKILEQGYKINAVQIENHEIGVDTIDDLNYLIEKYETKRE